MKPSLSLSLSLSLSQILEDAAIMLQRMKHRGGCGGDNDTGDGAGMMTSIPHTFYARVVK